MTAPQYTREPCTVPPNLRRLRSAWNWATATQNNDVLQGVALACPAIVAQKTAHADQNPALVGVTETGGRVSICITGDYLLVTRTEHTTLLTIRLTLPAALRTTTTTSTGATP